MSNALAGLRTQEAVMRTLANQLQQVLVNLAVELRQQGFSGAAMLPYSELEYGGIVDRLKAMDSRFHVVSDKQGIKA